MPGAHATIAKPQECFDSMPEASSSHNATKAQNTLPKPLDGRSNEYQAWKKDRLLQHDQQLAGANKTQYLSSLLNHKSDHAALVAIIRNVRSFGYAIYQWTDTPTDIASSVSKLNATLGLTTSDQGVMRDNSNLSLLTDQSGTDRGRFIPYTSRAMGWHTDGYYNAPDKSIRSFTLHCMQPAATGGALSLMDYELLLIAVYDADPALIKLLSHPHSMTLPANKDNLGHDRPDQHVPVFFSYKDGLAGVRFTTRTKNIQWRNTETHAAATQVIEIIKSQENRHHNVRLISGQGLVTRNILHRREPFKDDPELANRQMLRGRYLQALNSQLPDPVIAETR